MSSQRPLSNPCLSQRDVLGVLPPGGVLRESLGGVMAFGLAGIVSALIGVGVSIALAVMLTPVEFGIFATTLVILNVISSLRDFGLSSYLIFQKEEPTPREVRTAFSVQLAFCTVVYTLVLLFGMHGLPMLFHLPEEIAQFIAIVGLTVFLLPFSSIGGVYIQRRLAYRQNALIEFVHQTAYGVVAVLMAWYGWGHWSLGVAYIVAAALRISLLYYVAPWPIGLDWDSGFWKWGFSYGMKIQVAGMTSLVKDGMPAALGGILFGPEVVGYLNWAARLSQQAGQAVSSVAASVTFPSFVRLRDDPSALGRMVSTAIRYINLVSLPLLTMVCALAPELVHEVYTDKWVPGILSLYWFALGMAAYGLTMTLDHLLRATGRAGLSLTITVIGTAVGWMAGAVLGVMWDFSGIAIGYTVGVGVSVVGLVLVVRAGGHKLSLRYVFVNPVLAALVAGLGVLLVKPVLAGSVGGVIVCAVLGSAVFCVALLGLERGRLWREVAAHTDYCRRVLFADADTR